MKTKNNYSEKPYNRCLHCEFQVPGQERCDGPRTSAMPTERWKEFMRDVKDMKHLTYADIEERTGGQLSIKTIQTVLAPGGHGKDLMRETARMIENAIMGSSNQYPCYLAFVEELPDDSKTVKELQAELAQLRGNIARTHDFQEKELAIVRAEAQKKIDFLKTEIEWLHKIVDNLSKE